MTEHLQDWIATLSQSPSFRHIYSLSVAAAEGRLVAPPARAAARRLVRTLDAVIDLPVADARILAKARKQFLRLRRAVLGGAGLARLESADTVDFFEMHPSRSDHFAPCLRTKRPQDHLSL